MEKSAHDDASELPGYSTRRASTTNGIGGSEHTYSLENSKGHKWLSITVKSRSKTSTALPLFHEKDVITGKVLLDLDKPENIKGIILTVKAGTTSVGQEEELFLNLTQELWNPASGHPTDPKGSASKLKGQFSWPFSIQLPSEVSIKDSKTTSMFSLPPTFSERASPAYIDYKLAVLIKRPALKVNQILTTNFSYLPITLPDPPSELRQVAYREGSQLVGPDADPEGWLSLPPVKVKGTLFETRKFEVDCQLAIGTPLSYALGAPIPLFLTLTGSDSQALDLLSTPSAIRLYLVRSLAIGSDATNEDSTGRSNNYFKESAGRAAFWPSSEGAQEEGKRVLQGEIDIKASLKPTFAFPKLSIRYTLELLPFEASGFADDAQPTDILISERVRVVSKGFPGISPRSYAPPGYVQPQGGDYNKAMGLLENGNQRFYHHGSHGGIS